MKEILASLGIEEHNLGGFGGEWIGSGPELAVATPIDGSQIATVQRVTEEEYDTIVSNAQAAYLHWRTVPPPQRGELVRLLGNRLRELKSELGALVTLEMGKIRAEGEGEVQETGGGRESGSDTWKVYMRRQTNTVNWSTELPLAQGIEFG